MRAPTNEDVRCLQCDGLLDHPMLPAFCRGLTTSTESQAHVPPACTGGPLALALPRRSCVSTLVRRDLAWITILEAFRALSGRRNRYRHLTKLSWMTYARSSSDLAQPFGLSSQTCHCLDVRISRPGAGPLGGDCFPRLTAMYLAEAKPPVVWRPSLRSSRDGLCVKEQG